MLSVQEVEKAINIPANQWEGRCHEIAVLILRSGLVKGRDVYGHYLGNVVAGTLFSSYPIVQHGWIETEDGKVIDPTRWVFENVEPYIYYEDKNEEYDEGGNKYRMDNLKEKPEYKSDSKQLELGYSQDHLIIRMALDLPENRESISVEEAFWLANLPLQMLTNTAKAVYLFLVNNGMKAFIPIDNYKSVFRK